MSSKNWCFTLFSDDIATDAPLDDNEGPLELWRPEDMQYLIYQIEEAPDTHRQHAQGFVQLKKKIRVSGVKKLFAPYTPHLEVMRGTAAEAKAYCEKEESRVAGPWQWGEIISMGQRTDLEEVCKAIKSGASKRKIAEDYPVQTVKFSKGLENYRHIIDHCPKWRQVQVTYIWGDAGVGKTRSVWDSEKDVTSIYKVEGDAKWWDGYDGQSTILFDDFRGQIPFLKMLEYLDGHPVQVEVKGAWVYAKWTRVWITANRPQDRQYQKKHAMPDDNLSWWEDLLTPEERAAWERRVPESIHMGAS